MALDGTTTGDATLCWPGDAARDASLGGMGNKSCPSYLSTNDFSKLLSAPGIITCSSTSRRRQRHNRVNVYAVAENHPGDTIFLSSANWTNIRHSTPDW